MAQHAPFGSHGKKSVRAKGTVSRVEIHHGGKTASVTVRHEAPKKKAPGKGGVFGQDIVDSYPQETTAIMPAEHAKRFTAGSPVAVHIGPASEIGDTAAEGGEVGGGSENEDGEEADADDSVAAVGAKGPKQAGGKKSGSLIRSAAAKGAKK